MRLENPEKQITKTSRNIRRARGAPTIAQTAKIKHGGEEAAMKSLTWRQIRARYA